MEVLNTCYNLIFDCILLMLFRIQNMKIIDGVPEYKNGFVSTVSSQYKQLSSSIFVKHCLQKCLKNFHVTLMQLLFSLIGRDIRFGLIHACLHELSCLKMALFFFCRM